MAGWGATTDYLAPGPPAARTRGRSRANSAEQPPADVQRVCGRVRFKCGATSRPPQQEPGCEGGEGQIISGHMTCICIAECPSSGLV